MPSQTYELHDVPIGLMTELVVGVVAAESPVHRDEIITRLRTLWGLQRADERIRTAVQRGGGAAARCERLNFLQPAKRVGKGARPLDGELN